MATVIVFGPTGNVGASTALAARKHGAKVVLAMRDPAKTLPAELAEQEKAGGFIRVKADLTDPESISAAVKSSGATRAYIYNAFGSPDFMKATLEALKSAGVTFVVFLSTASIQKSQEDLSPEEVIPYVHGQVELNINAIFGRGNWASIRAGAFITNLLVWHSYAWPNGPVKLYNPEAVLDNITPEDMGDVSGAILVGGLKNDNHLITLTGPEVVSQREAITKVSRGLGRHIEIQEVDAKEAAEVLSLKIPPPIVSQLIAGLSPPRTGWEWLSDYKQGVINIELYAGRPGVTAEEWVAKHKELFA